MQTIVFWLFLWICLFKYKNVATWMFEIKFTQLQFFTICYYISCNINLICFLKKPTASMLKRQKLHLASRTFLCKYYIINITVLYFTLSFPAFAPVQGEKEESRVNLRPFMTWSWKGKENILVFVFLCEIKWTLFHSYS